MTAWISERKHSKIPLLGLGREWGQPQPGPLFTSLLYSVERIKPYSHGVCWFQCLLDGLGLQNHIDKCYLTEDCWNILSVWLCDKNNLIFCAEMHL